MSNNRVEQQLGDYILDRLLGSGSFADVYLVHNVYIENMLAAIKIVKGNLAQQDHEMFRQEAKTLAGLRNPNIVRVLGYGIADGAPYIIMDYAPNGTLRSRHPRGSKLPSETAVFYVNQICAALQYAHNQNLIHRDLKPENILIGANGEILLTDFGIATIARATLTQEQSDYSGSPIYSAPEQLNGRPRLESDQYALGVMLYEWLTGSPPFQGNFIELCAQHAQTLPIPLRVKVPEIPPAIEAVVMKALSKDYRLRYRNMTELAQAYEQACSIPTSVPSLLTTAPTQVAVEQPPIPRGNSLPIPTRFRNIALIVLAFMVVLAGFIAILVGINQNNSQMSATATAVAISNNHMTATARVKLTATAFVNATATEEANPYGSGGTLVYSDPLSDNSHGYGWAVSSNQIGTCAFIGGGYDVSTNGGLYCADTQDLGDFTFEVQSQIIQGDTDGIDFHLNNADHTFDAFILSNDGRYFLSSVPVSGPAKSLVKPSFSAFINQRGQTNLLAVVAQSSKITLYINHHLLASVNDSTYNYGYLALVAWEYNTGGHPTEVRYTNAKVWE